jgi:hypothetical protein
MDGFTTASMRIEQQSELLTRQSPIRLTHRGFIELYVNHAVNRLTVTTWRMSSSLHPQRSKTSAFRLIMPAQLWSRGHRVPPSLGTGSQEETDELAIPASQPQPPNPPVSTVERPPGCINKYPTPGFSLLCTMMDRLRSEEASKRKETLSRFFELWRVKVGNDLYPLVRLLLPDVSCHAQAFC